MTQDAIHLIKANKKLIHSLPLEILKEVFCNVDSEALPGLRLVCWLWCKLIDEVMYVHQLDVPERMMEDAVDMFSLWKTESNGRASFMMYGASSSIRNIISKPTLNRNAKVKFDLDTSPRKYKDIVFELEASDYLSVLKKIEYHATRGGAYGGSCKDPLGSTWRTVLGITGLPYSVEELRSRAFDDDFVKSILNVYRWYMYESDGMIEVPLSVGIIALYPDNMTYSNLFATDTD